MVTNEFQRWRGVAIVAMLFLAVVAVACESKKKKSNSANQSPVADFTATPTTGIVPLTVTFTNTGSNFTSVEWDFGDTTDSDETHPAHTYVTPGTYTVRMTATNGVGSTECVKVDFITVTAPTVAISVDTNRDGQITAADEANKNVWNAQGGAVFWQNVDDDDSNGIRDFLDSVVNGANDANDLARIIVRQIPDAPTDGTVSVGITPTAARPRIRIFRKSGASWSVVYNASGSSFSLPIADVIAGDVELGIEAIAPRSTAWNGEVLLNLALRDSVGNTLNTDSARMRNAPWIMATNLWPVRELIVCNLGANNANFRNAMRPILTAHNITFVEYTGYSLDRWIQDSHEPGAYIMPHPTQPRQFLDVTLQCARSRPADQWCLDNQIKPDFGAYPKLASSDQSPNYGGNLECIPPHTAPNGKSYPFGRVIVGGGDAGTVENFASGHNPPHMDQAYFDFFAANDIQGPALEVSSEWLLVGHIDEFFMFVPAPARARGWAVVIASPTLTRNILQDLANSGFGNTTIFTGRAQQRTVNQILNDAGLMAFNDKVQARIDSVRQVLKTEIGLSDADFVEIPTLYEAENVFGDAVALNPGMPNLVSVPTASGDIHFFVPDPEGPHTPDDAWAVDAQTKLEALGTAQNPVIVTFVDVYTAYHLQLGEAHCGTNAVRTPPNDQWWDK